MAVANVWSGPRARLKINGAVVGFASGVSGSESVEYEPVDVLDLLEVREYVPVAYRSTFNAQIFRLIGNSLKAQGIFPREENILTSGDLDAALEDRVTGKTMALFQGVKCSEHSWDVSARSIVNESVSFVCIRVRDESEQ